MDGCLPDPDKKYPLRSDGPANFAFSDIVYIVNTVYVSDLYFVVCHTFGFAGSRSLNGLAADTPRL